MGRSSGGWALWVDIGVGAGAGTEMETKEGAGVDIAEKVQKGV